MGPVIASMAQPATSEEAVKLVSVGKEFLSQGQNFQALWAFRQAAKAGNVDGAFQAGELLLKQARNSRGSEQIIISSECIGWLFLAATNQHPYACAELSTVLENGIGIQTNLIAAYAWLKLASQIDSSMTPELDRLVVHLNPADIHVAQDLSHEYQLGHWPADLVRPVDRQDARFKVQGVTVNRLKPMVILNNVTFATGDSGQVRPTNSTGRAAGERLSIKCLGIGDDYVLITIAGEPNLKVLSTRPF
jgi:hypothetical protein